MFREGERNRADLSNSEDREKILPQNNETEQEKRRLENMKKRNWNVFDIRTAVIAAILLVIVFCCGAASAEYSGTWGNLNWTLDDSGILTISGDGDIKFLHYNSNDAWLKHTESIQSVIISDGVTSIGYAAFRDCSSLISITIPDGVTSIGDWAFNNCSSLTSITIPDDVTSIGNYAFRDCSSLTSITFPDDVTSIGYSAFDSCSSLTGITIPDGVTSIGDYAF